MLEHQPNVSAAPSEQSGQSQGVSRGIACLESCVARIRNLELWRYRSDDVNGPMIVLDRQRFMENEHESIELLSADCAIDTSVLYSVLGEIAALGYFEFSGSLDSLYYDVKGLRGIDEYRHWVESPGRSARDVGALLQELAALGKLTASSPFPEMLQWTYMGPQGFFRVFDQGFSLSLPVEQYLAVQRKNLEDKIRLFAQNRTQCLPLLEASAEMPGMILLLSPGREESKTGFNVSLGILDGHGEVRTAYKLGFSFIPDVTNGKSIRVHSIQTSRAPSSTLTELRANTNRFQSILGLHPHQALIRGLEVYLTSQGGDGVVIDSGLQNYWLRFHQALVDPCSRMALHATKLGFEFSDTCDGWIRSPNRQGSLPAQNSAIAAIVEGFTRWFGPQSSKVLVPAV